MSFLRRRALRKGVSSENELFRLISLLLIGRPALVRRDAYRQGFRGSSRFWRVIAYGFVANDIRRKLTVKEPDQLGVERLVEGQTVTITALPRATGRSRRGASRAS
jgi:hypothetical protein